MLCNLADLRFRSRFTTGEIQGTFFQLLNFALEHAADLLHLAPVDPIVGLGISGRVRGNQLPVNQFVEDFLYLSRLTFDCLFQQPPFDDSVEGILRRRVRGKVTQYVLSDLTLVRCTHMHQSRWPIAWDQMQLCGPPQTNDFLEAFSTGCDISVLELGESSKAGRYVLWKWMRSK